MKKRIAPKLKIKKGDLVQVIAGEYKNVQGEVLEIYPKRQRVLVDGVNMVHKHQKPTNEHPGGIVEQAAPIHISNVMVVDPKSGEPTRGGRRREEGKLGRCDRSRGG